MQGKVVLITGATNGIGLETAKALAKMGTRVVMVGRSPAKMDKAAEAVRAEAAGARVDTRIADLSLMAEVRKLAAEVEAAYDRLDVLINNAGAFFNSYQTTSEGLEMTFALNHLNYFLLTNLLLDLLKDSAPARIINTSSGAHRIGRLNFDNLQGEKGYGGFRAYGQSKLENVLFTYELARRLEGSGVTANALHPGFVRTGFGHSNGGIVSFFTGAMQRFALTPAQGAATTIYLASSPEVADVSGKYFEKSRAVPSSKASMNEADWVRLWQISEQLTDLTESGAV